MYLLNVSYIQLPAAVEPLKPAHGAWVKKHLSEGVFLFAGPKTSGLGGVIVTKSVDRALLNAILSQDPYVTENVAEYQVVAFDCNAAVPDLAGLTGQ